MDFNMNRQTCRCRFKILYKSILWIALVSGIMYGSMVYISSYFYTEHDMKLEINLLMTEINLLKNKHDSDLNSVRREFEHKLTVLRPRVGEELFDELSVRSLSKVSDIARKIAAEEILLYDADKTGKPDFALQNSGGSILSVRNTEHFLKRPNILGIPIGPHSHSAENIIQAGVLPGECWAFEGSKGAVVIQLIADIYVTGVSVEHIPPALSPTGATSSAPKDMSVWGLKCLDDEEETLLGQFNYDNTGGRVQYFEIKDIGKSFSIVEFKIHSNHGDPRFTCVYRIRVHGKPKI
ncbi:SUN domain-containing protein 1-like isoform X1 [Zootermopsis nevadensis]|uniref:SUN domain-containing protein 1-like isoform X1 n=1 Tax=Zootermopsis nevadensis TaxID=136037 RepID=UPI000B8E3ACC|nr:SUN domain-containing protein 1-like isoform X1 [Zootermopsis nevadensis]